MTDTINDGGPAFPRSPHSGEASDDGMSLRDWFAGNALVGLAPLAEKYGKSVRGWAETAYQIADAMLAERERRRGDG